MTKDEITWETVAEEAPVMVEFDTIGDEFIAVFEGAREITLPPEKVKPGENGTFTQLNFRKDGTLYGINAGYKLRDAFDKIPEGKLCRIRYMADINVGQPSPMKDFRVQVAL